MGRGKSKGGQFERDMCRELSLWWTAGLDDEVFYRTASSGGRATGRSQKGKKALDHGDVRALDRVGQPLLDIAVVELKRGYNKDTLIDCLDRKDHSAQQTWEAWIEQAIRESDGAKVPYWLIITRRDQREPLIAMSEAFYEETLRYGACTKEFISCAMATIPVRQNDYWEENVVTIFLTRLELFFQHVKPQVIIGMRDAIVEQQKQRKTQTQVEDVSGRRGRSKKRKVSA